MKVLDLFSGIGGFSLGLERAGMETVAFCEIEKFPQKVLKKHWPDVPIYEDVRELTYDRLKSDGISGIDVICGGFPCQDISVAGKQAGIGEGTRSGLWSECARLVGEIRPKYAIFENVTALLSGEQGRWFQRVLFDLSQIGYDAEWHCIPASELGAHHHRDRAWIIAYPKGCGSQGQQPSRSGGESDSKGVFSEPAGICWNVADPNLSGLEQGNKAVEGGSPEQPHGCGVQPPQNVPHPYGEGLQRCLFHEISYQKGREVQGVRCASERGSGRERFRNGLWATEPNVGRVANGVPQRAHRLKSLGNAVVPQIPELIGRAIMEFENAS